MVQVDEDGRRELSSRAMEMLPRSIPGTNPLSLQDEDRPPVTLVLNKIDKASEMRWVTSREREFKTHGQFDGIFYTSATKSNGIVKLLEHLKRRAKPRHWLYPSDMLTTMSHTEQVKQVVNAYIFKRSLGLHFFPAILYSDSCFFLRFNSDVPYKFEQQTVGWTPRLDGTLMIEHELIVKDSVVARMILGVRNTILQQMRQKVTETLTALWGTSVDFRIWVRPLKQRLSKNDLAKIGYGSPGTVKAVESAKSSPIA
eukprot:symbB.v1.2.039541.t1/scaffold6635.1/size21105/2